ncbi:MAG: methylmalonyl-CoA epimerase [Chloroflexota bacterium]
MSTDDGVIQRLHHVAMAVESIEQSLGFYRDVLGLSEISILRVPERGLKVALIQVGNCEIELLEPTTREDNTVRKFLDRRGQGLHHVCFQVAEIDGAMATLKQRGAEFIEPIARPGAVGLVSFIPPSSAGGVLVELAQVLEEGGHRP